MNNPVMLVDENGDLPKWVKTGLVVLSSVATVAVIAATSGLAGPVLIGAGASFWETGLNKIYNNKLKLISNELISEIKLGIFKEFGSSFIQNIFIEL